MLQHRINYLNISKFVYSSISRYNRLWNSLAFILVLEESGKSPLLLAKYASSGHERYKAGGTGIGDKKTFSKGTVNKGEKVSEFKLNVKNAKSDMATAVKTVMLWMKKNMKE